VYTVCVLGVSSVVCKILTVSTDDVADADRWTDDDDDDDDDDVWDAGDNDGAVRNEASRHNNAAADHRGHYHRDADEADVVRGEHVGFDDGRSGIGDVRGHVGRTAAGLDGVHGVDNRAEGRYGSNNNEAGRYSNGRNGRDTDDGSSSRGMWRDRGGDSERRGDVGDRRKDIGHHNSCSVGATLADGNHAVTNDAGGYSTSDGRVSPAHMNLSSDKARRSRGDNVNDSGVTGLDGGVSRRNNGCDSDHGRGGSCLECRKNVGNEGASSAGGAAVGHHSDDITEDSQNQLAFVRLQRMRWLESKTPATTVQSESLQSQLVTTEKSIERSDKKPTSTVSPVHRPNKAVATSSGVNPPVVTHQSDPAVLHHTTCKFSATGSQRRETKAEPPIASHVGKETEQINVSENGKSCVDENLVRNCQNSQTRSGGMKLTIFGSRNDDNKEETEAAVKKNPGLDGERSRCMTASDSGLSESQGNESECHLQQQRVVDGQAVALLKLRSISDDNHSVETRPKAVAVEVQKVDTVSASMFTDPPLSGPRALLSTQNVISTDNAVEMPGTSDSVVSEAAVSPGLHDTFRQLNDFDRTDSGSTSRSNEVLNSSLRLDEPLIADAFDVYMKIDGLELWSQKHSPLQSLGTQLQHDFPSTQLLEDIVDTDKTLLKLPVIPAAEVASDKREEDHFAEETRTDCENACEHVTSNTPNVERSASHEKTRLWTCIYSRNDVGVGEVSTRLLPAYRDAESRYSVLDDVRTTTTSVDGICGKNEAINSQSSNIQSVYSPVCPPLDDWDTVTNDTKQSVCEEKSQYDATSQELLSCTPGELKFNSAKSCTETKFHGNICEKSSDDVLSTVRESICRDISSTDEPRDSISNQNSLPTGETNRPADADNRERLSDTDDEIPAEMEADFIDQMQYETCPNSSRSQMEDFPSGISLDIVVTHVVDARHFWGQIVNEGIQVRCYRYT